ncbi:hemerythrin family protein [Ruminiclostridium herbifermentans]|uniref:Hemerythrin family protein n=1 Tax=Ruminiclostridium herbifermentans TaxID=2488810 RepID=A0A4U7JLC4_9FIRM|nr:hemerythrin family protein [Ruminiclostridium herbifermentans]QNU68441.1 hemerythrin family protein [Ruminiclostridium herbifermentans]
MYEMKPEYFTGIDFIDEEHTKLFAIANECYDLLTNQFIEDMYDYILKVINELKDYTKYHFNHEEEYMKSIGYKKFLSHKVEHNDFIEKINSIDYEHIDNNQKDALLKLLDFLTAWLVNHILKQDTVIGK